AGVALITPNGLRVIKRAGKVRELEAALPKRLRGAPGIAHTRWATHGVPNDANAHPHCDTGERFAVVHNGIIENAAALRANLISRGHTLTSDTDTELLAHLIAAAQGPALVERVREALGNIEGTYGIAVIDAHEPDCIVVARNGSPVVLGIGDREMHVASDISALVRHTHQVVHLDDGELAVVRQNGFETSTLDARPTTKKASTINWDVSSYERGDFEHYMLKEISEQPQSCARTLSGRIEQRFDSAHLGGLNLSARDLLDIRRIKILGCGSAYYAGLAGAHIIESLTRIPTDAEAASEFRYRNPVIEKDVLYIAVSQSGETLDTLMALQEVRRKGGRVLGVVNVVGSTIARECDGGIYIHAGPEISVASTKTFTSTAIAFALFALHVGRIRDLGPSEGRRLINALEKLPDQIAQITENTEQVKAVASKYSDAQNMFFIGRAGAYPIALEGAQKLKEIAYVHAQAYPAAELKHGPLALVSPQTPTVAIIPDGPLFAKSIGSIEEIRARLGPVIALGHEGVANAGADAVLTVPKTEPELDPILLNVPLQLFAYYAARALKRDIDQPRNLAKSVTVE
ncbi:MAG: glucosamine--fructose-6-phosphate aminotransferase (isomerizing), partial [Gammaproteobacteria bacterium]